MRDNGNEVLVYTHSSWAYGFNKKIPSSLLNELKAFNPDLFVFFNNSFWDISGYFDCPIIVYVVDSVSQIHNIENLKIKKDRFTYIVMQTSEIDDMAESLNIPKSKIYYIPPFTSIQNTHQIKTKNIFFCGGLILWNGIPELLDYLRKMPNDKDAFIAREVVKHIIKYPLKDYDDVYDFISDKYQIKPSVKLCIKDKVVLIGRLSGIRRARYLNAVADLGLEFLVIRHIGRILH